MRGSADRAAVVPRPHPCDGERWVASISLARMAAIGLSSRNASETVRGTPSPPDGGEEPRPRRCAKLRPLPGGSGELSVLHIVTAEGVPPLCHPTATR